MDSLNVYDSQLASYYKKRKITTLPLLSWDVYSRNLDELSNTTSDILKIKKVMNKLTVNNVDIVSELKENKKTVIITDENLNIEFASENMLEMSGYMPSEILGQSPKMFQGASTDVEEAKKIRKHVNAGEPFEATLVNYKKNKTTYNCYIKGYPIFNKKGIIVKYLAIEQAA